MLRETTSRGLCEIERVLFISTRLVCPPRTSERGGEGYCVKEGGGGSLLLFITAVPNTKMCAWGEEDSGEHVL